MEKLQLKKKLVEEDLLKLENVLDEAINDFKDEANGFYKSKIFKMGRFIRLYSELMQHLGVDLKEDTFEELENIDFESKSDADNRKRLELFIENWDQFLAKVEKNKKKFSF